MFLDWLRWEFTERGGWDRHDAVDPVLRFARYVLFENEALGNSLRNLESGEPQDIANQLRRRKVAEELLIAFAQTWREFVSFRVELDRGIARYRKHYKLGQARVRAA
jgi:hypothetical protein